MSKNSKKTYKLVIIGDQSVGKTCLIYTYANGEFPSDFVPAIHSRYRKKGQQSDAYIVDSFGQIPADTERWDTYEKANLYLLCFSVVDPVSFNNLTTGWTDLVRQKEKHPNFLLVGLKTDLRGDNTVINGLQSQGLRPIMPEEGKLRANEVEACGYVECSALSGNGVKEVFDQAVKYAESPSAEGNCCTVA